MPGALASMSRAEAADLIRGQGGKLVGTVGPATNLLVVGEQTWPLRKNGGLSPQLGLPNACKKAAP